MNGPLRAAVHAAQQCADRGLLKFVFVSSDDAFITHMLGMYLSARHSCSNLCFVSSIDAFITHMLRMYLSAHHSCSNLCLVSSIDAFITHMLGMYLSAHHSNARCPHVPRWHWMITCLLKALCIRVQSLRALVLQANQGAARQLPWRYVTYQKRRLCNFSASATYPARRLQRWAAKNISHAWKVLF